MSNHQPMTGYHLLHRRSFLGDLGLGLSSIALAHLLDKDGLLGEEPTRPDPARKPMVVPKIDPARPHAPRGTHFPAAAKNVLVIFCSGACSHLDTFDYKPELIRQHGKP